MAGLVVGATAKLSTTIDVDGVDANPSGLSVAVTSPSGVVTTYVLGVNAELTQDLRNGLPRVGHYSCLVPCTAAGKWTFIWQASGVAPGVAPRGDYDVEAF